MPNDVKQQQESSPEESQEDVKQNDNKDSNTSDSENSIPYSRFKEVNSEKKQLEEELKKLKESSETSNKSEKDSDKKSKSSEVDIDSIIEVAEATKDLNSDEISELKLRAKAKGVSLTEARQDENYKTWLEAKRAKVEKQNKTPEPDSRKAPENKSYEEYTLDDYQQLSDDEKIKYNQWRKKQPEGKSLGF